MGCESRADGTEQFLISLPDPKRACLPRALGRVRSRMGRGSRPQRALARRYLAFSMNCSDFDFESPGAAERSGAGGLGSAFKHQLACRLSPSSRPRDLRAGLTQSRRRPILTQKGKGGVSIPTIPLNGCRFRRPPCLCGSRSRPQVHGSKASQRRLPFLERTHSE